jgi:hypothetical protein
MQLMGREERVFSIHHERLVAVYIYGRTNVMESHGGTVKIKDRSRGLCKMELSSRVRQLRFEQFIGRFTCNVSSQLQAVNQVYENHPSFEESIPLEVCYS